MSDQNNPKSSPDITESVLILPVYAMAVVILTTGVAAFFDGQCCVGTALLMLGYILASGLCQRW